MRRLAPTTLLLVIATLALESCENATAPPSDIAGIWAEDLAIPGASLILDIAQSGLALSGTGTYSIEAGRSGTLQIVGTYSRPDVSVSISFDYGLTETFTGTVRDSRHMSGSVASNGGSSSLSFTRQ